MEQERDVPIRNKSINGNQTAKNNDQSNFSSLNNELFNNLVGQREIRLVPKSFSVHHVAILYIVSWKVLSATAANQFQFK